MIPGEKVKIGDKEYEIPPLNIKLLRKHQTDLDALTNPEVVGKLGVTGYALKAIPVLTENLKRNYPSLTEEEIEEILPISDVAVVIKAMFKASGFDTAAGTTRPLVAPGGVPSTSP